MTSSMSLRYALAPGTMTIGIASVYTGHDCIPAYIAVLWSNAYTPTVVKPAINPTYTGYTRVCRISNRVFLAVVHASG